jgi:hypothetical protein
MLTLHSVMAAVCVTVRLAAPVLIVALLVHFFGAPPSDQHPFEE